MILILREKYPDLYAVVGRPAVFSRSVNFLWLLKRFKDQLSTQDVRLLQINLGLIYLFSAEFVLFLVFLIVL